MKFMNDILLILSYHKIIYLWNAIAALCGCFMRIWRFFILCFNYFMWRWCLIIIMEMALYYMRMVLFKWRRYFILWRWCCYMWNWCFIPWLWFFLYVKVLLYVMELFYVKVLFNKSPQPSFPVWVTEESILLSKWSQRVGWGYKVGLNFSLPKQHIRMCGKYYWNSILKKTPFLNCPYNLYLIS